MDAAAESQTQAQKIAAAIGAKLAPAGRNVATVESCTGGGVAQVITAVAGASAWFERGFVTYSNAAKTDLVGVPADLIKLRGAVSVETAAAMAEGGLRRADADFCVAVTGVAGPGGGTARNPVGTVCFGWAGRGQETVTAREHFAGDRAAIRGQSVARALAGLLDFIAAAGE